MKSNMPRHSFVLKSNLSNRILFEQIRLKEPPKSVVHDFSNSDDIQRFAFAAVLDREQQKVFEFVVDLNTSTIQSEKHIEGVQVAYIIEEWEEMVGVIKQHPDFISAVNKRGIVDVNQVYIDAYGMANFASAEERHLRLSKAHCFFVENPGDNSHVRPIEGLVPVIDLNHMEVIKKVEDYGIRPIPSDTGIYRAEQLPNIKPPAG